MNTSKNWIWILIVVAVLILIWAVWQYGVFNKLSVNNNNVTLPSGSDTTAQISNDLSTVDIGNPDEDLKPLDSDLNKL